MEHYLEKGVVLDEKSIAFPNVSGPVVTVGSHPVPSLRDERKKGEEVGSFLLQYGDP